MAYALDAIGRDAFTPARREFVTRRRAVIAANPELQEREALKALSLTASMIDALTRRGVSDLTAHVASQLGWLAWKIAYDRWIDAPDGEDFGEIARRTLGELQAASVLTADKSAAFASGSPYGDCPDVLAAAPVRTRADDELTTALPG